MSASLAAGLIDDGHEFRLKPRVFKLLRQVFLADPEPLFDRGQALLQGLGIVAQQKNAEGRIAIDQHAAFAVEQGAARGDDRDVADLIAFGEIGKMAGLDDLQLPESHKQQDDERYRNVGKKRQPPLRDFLVVNAPRCQRNSCAGLGKSSLPGARSYPNPCRGLEELSYHSRRAPRKVTMPIWSPLGTPKEKGYRLGFSVRRLFWRRSGRGAEGRR